MNTKIKEEMVILIDEKTGKPYKFYTYSREEDKKLNRPIGPYLGKDRKNVINHIKLDLTGIYC